VERGYPYPEKLVEVVGEDAKETKPVVKRVRWIFCLL
jgi:hypothetical protein